MKSLKDFSKFEKKADIAYYKLNFIPNGNVKEDMDYIFPGHLSLVWPDERHRACQIISFRYYV